LRESSDDYYRYAGKGSTFCSLSTSSLVYFFEYSLPIRPEICTGKPMVTLNHAVAWDSLRLVGIGDRMVGYVRAETIQQAVALVGHPEVNVYTLPAGAAWPGEAGEAVWRCG
jgi:hypothetical protein